MKSKNICILIWSTIFLSACGFNDQIEKAKETFGDQHFKTAIALIELHKIREGQYPDSLAALKYLGDWDKMIFNSVSYKKLDEGYGLDLTGALIKNPATFEYPDEFWKGLGLKKSNLKKE